MAGPRNTGSLGDETFPTLNKILRGQGGDHLYDSNITDDNTKVSISIPVTVTGSFTVTTGSNVELQVTNTGVKLGNVSTDTHTVTGSLGVSGSLSVIGTSTFNNSNVSGIGNNWSFSSNVFYMPSSTNGFLSLTGNRTFNFSNSNTTIGIMTMDGSTQNTLIGNSMTSAVTAARLVVRGSGSAAATATARFENSSQVASLIILDNNTTGINRVPTSSLDVAGTTRISGSFNTAISGSILTVVGSGSAQPIFTVQGSQGELFSVTDSLSGSLFSVNDISGLPVMEVFSDNTILMGDYLDPMLLTTKKITQTNSGSFVIYNIPTSSYDGAFIEYTIKSGSNARAGTIMSTWANSSIQFTEVDTIDIGSTAAVGLTMILSGSNAVMTGSSSTGAWTIRTIIRAI